MLLLGSVTAMSFSSAISEALSPATRDRILAHPEFHPTAEALAARGLAHTQAQDEAAQWLTKDVGRAALYAAALILDAMVGRVSVYDLVVAAAMNGTCSRGRVLAWVNYARSCGRLEVLPGDGHWTKHPLKLTPAFADFARTRFWRELEAAAAMLPEARAALALREDPRAFPAALAATGQAFTLRRETFQAEETRLQPFMAREAGMRLLRELICRQSNERPRFLHEVALSRRELAGRLNISRVHINTLLGDAEAQGLLSSVPAGGIVFSPELSYRVEQHFAWLLQLQVLNARVVLEACGASSTEQEEAGAGVMTIGRV